MIEITLHGCDPGRLSLNNGMHYQTRYRKQKAAKRAAHAAWMAAGRPRSEVPVIVDIVVRRGRSMDHDNIVSGLKGSIDGLFKDAITPDDSAKWVELGAIVLETGKRFADKPCVVFIVSPRDP